MRILITLRWETLLLGMPQGHLIAVHVEDATAAAELHNEVHLAALGKGQYRMNIRK